MIDAPSAYFRQHHAVEAPVVDDQTFRQFFRVRTKLDQLLSDNAISIGVWYAGIMFRTAIEIVISEDFPSSSMIYAENVGAQRELSPGYRADARKRLRVVRAALSGRDYRLLEQHLIDDLPWHELARQNHVHAKTVRRWTIAALNALAKI